MLSVTTCLGGPIHTHTIDLLPRGCRHAAAPGATMLDAGREAALPLPGVTEWPDQASGPLVAIVASMSLPLSVIPTQTSKCPTSPMTAAPMTVLNGVLSCLQEASLPTSPRMSSPRLSPAGAPLPACWPCPTSKSSCPTSQNARPWPSRGGASHFVHHRA